TARAIRDGSYAAVTSGAHGFAVSHAGTWTFSGTSLTSTGSYASVLTVTPIASDWMTLSSLTNWKHGYNRSGSVLLTTELTDWQGTRTVGNWSSLTVDGS